jgi:hypothetical protein
MCYLKEKKEKTEYSFLVGLSKGIKYFIIFFIPYVISLFVDFPSMYQLMTGGLLVVVLNYIKIRILKV